MAAGIHALGAFSDNGDGTVTIHSQLNIASASSSDAGVIDITFTTSAGASDYIVQVTPASPDCVIRAPFSERTSEGCVLRGVRGADFYLGVIKVA